MHLLKTDIQQTGKLTLVEKNPKQMVGLEYAILSHVWEENEIIFENILVGESVQSKRRASRDKIYKACGQAAKDGFPYIWIDTCCIDKRSSAELSEAINSMFAWYRDAAICYAYLNDAPTDPSTGVAKAEFTKSKWFRRGWTLQELLAPKEVEFFSGNWTPIGEKRALSDLLAEITGIDREILLGEMPLSSASIARRMSWASKREVTRPEDIAYSLMGIFSVNMPMLYGEGAEKAFLRLQEEIMRESDDQSLFAWTNESSHPNARFGLLALSPSNFLYSNSVIPYQDFEPRSPYTMTNRGLRIEVHLTALGDGQYVAAVDCPPPPDFENSSFLAIYLEKLSECDEQYARVKAGTFAMVRRRGPLQTIYVRQKPHEQSYDGAFPHHMVKIRKKPSPDVYKVIRMLPDASPSVTPPTFPMLRGADQLSAAIIFQRDDGERIAVLVGSLKRFQVGFDAWELDISTDPGGIEFKSMQRLYKPSAPGQIKLEYHNVSLSATTVVQASSKYYIIDIEVEKVKLSTRISEKLLGAYDAATGSNTLKSVDKAPRKLRERASGLLRNQGKSDDEVNRKKSSLWWQLKH